MANVKLRKINARQHGGAVPYGNLSTLAFQLVTTAAGIAVDGDSLTALAAGDVLDLGPLPEGFRMNDSTVVISTGLTASVTGSLGFKYEDGIDSAAVPQDAAYFGTGIALAAAARVRNASSKALVILPKPARLILTIAGADNAKASKVDFIINGELAGPR